MSEEKVIALSRFRADVSRAQARRARELLLAPDMQAQVQALEPLEAYFIIKELGVAEATPLLLCATSEQLQTFIDLDCWQGETPSILDLDAWLASFVNEGALAEAFLALDEEMQVTYLAESFAIYDLRSEEAPPPASDEEQRRTTPDSFFVLVPREFADERELDPMVLIDSLYRASVEEAFRLLMAAKWDSGADTVERAYQFRAARLAELGFPEPAEAQRLFAPPPANPRKVLPVGAGSTGPRLPALYATPFAEDSYLGRVLARLNDAEQIGRVENDLVTLVNTAVIAYGDAPRDLAHAADTARRVRDVLSLGLEVLLTKGAAPLAPDSEQGLLAAVELVRAVPLLDLFRHGHREVQALQHSARALASDPVVKSWLEQPGTESTEPSRDNLDRAFLRALIAPHPLLGGFDPIHPERVRAFASRDELAAGERRLDELARRAGLN